MLIRILILSALVFGPVHTWAGRHGREHGGFFIKELNLSADQLSKVKDIKNKYRPLLKESRKSADDAKQELAASLQAPKKGPEYKAELLEKFKKVQDLKRAQYAKRFEMALEIRELLSNDQISKFKAMIERHDFRRDKRDEDDGDGE